MPQLVENIKQSIRAIPDFPKKGILFRDITPLLLDPVKFRSCIERFAEKSPERVDSVVSIESRGFILGSALAFRLGAGFVPVRKEGKLPCSKVSAAYDLEYGKAVIEVHADCVKKGARVIVIDDVLATGGTMRAAIELLEKLGAKIDGLYFLIELAALGGREKLKNYPVFSLVTY